MHTELRYIQYGRLKICGAYLKQVIIHKIYSLDIFNQLRLLAKNNDKVDTLTTKENSLCNVYKYYV